MPILNGDDGLLELSEIRDFYVDGLHHIELLGENVRMVYFRWRLFDGLWRKAAAEFASVRPASSVPMAILTDVVPIMARPELRMALHS